MSELTARGAIAAGAATPNAGIDSQQATFKTTVPPTTWRPYRATRPRHASLVAEVERTVVGWEATPAN
ncbi:hypothetical protein ICW40_03285 [Actinotalea ferrariae]|uniref:hypothetical protein n=1 Tax=Actinotalea ferrariae TaxID=1386098 RepID=UPI001C8B1A33|nr:hypothetical protein [Actinotalea ferrariae]MBX9243828.1 hypothetical protein [Actinotalea ferrariae]